MNSPAPSVPPSTRLLRLDLTKVAWEALSSATRRMLRVPLAWHQQGEGDKATQRPERLRWKDTGRGRVAYVVEGSAPAAEVDRVLSAAGAKAQRERGNNELRRVPMGAVLTDPAGGGDRVTVETRGLALLVRSRRGRWARYEVLRASWPDEAQEVLGDWVAPVEGMRPIELAEPPRFALEESAPKLPKGTAWKVTSCWHHLDVARKALTERAEMIHAAKLASPPRWRVVDLGTGVVRATAVIRKGAVVRRDIDPAKRGSAATSPSPEPRAPSPEPRAPSHLPSKSLPKHRPSKPKASDVPCRSKSTSPARSPRPTSAAASGTSSRPVRRRAKTRSPG